jgi:hypothetical protein
LVWKYAIWQPWWRGQLLKITHASEVLKSILRSGANFTAVSYNASVVKIYIATNSMARFYNIYLSPWRKKRSSLLQRWRCT